MNKEYDDKIKNRLKRIEGQNKGILRMMDDSVPRAQEDIVKEAVELLVKS